MRMLIALTAMVTSEKETSRNLLRARLDICLREICLRPVLCKFRRDDSDTDCDYKPCLFSAPPRVLREGRGNSFP